MRLALLVSVNQNSGLALMFLTPGKSEQSCQLLYSF